MLIRFTVGNYRSIRVPVTLSMVAAALKAADPLIDKVNTLVVPGMPLLGSAVIYGANASGKSNLIRAMAVMKRLVVDSARAGQIGDRLPMEPFLLSDQTRGQPTFFEIVFRAEDGEGGERQYRYGFEATATEIVSEWLFQKKQRESRVFERTVGEKPYFSDWFPEAKTLEPLVRSNSLFLSVAAQLNQPVATSLVRFYELLKIVTADEGTDTLDFTREYISQEGNRARVTSLLSSLDTSVSDVVVDDAPDIWTYGAWLRARDVNLERWKAKLDAQGRSWHKVALQTGVDPNQALFQPTPRVRTRHQVSDQSGEPEAIVEFDLETQESRGTNRIFALAGPILAAHEKGSVLVIDEIESQLHPRITRAIMEMFGSNRPEGSRAQLIAATHESNLLDERLLRRDQIWFVEKDGSGATDLFSLADIKVRNDANYRTHYLRGAYGAVPVIDTAELVTSISGADE